MLSRFGAGGMFARESYGSCVKHPPNRCQLGVVGRASCISSVCSYVELVPLADVSVSIDGPCISCLRSSSVVGALSESTFGHDAHTTSFLSPGGNAQHSGSLSSTAAAQGNSLPDHQWRKVDMRYQTGNFGIPLWGVLWPTK